MWQLWEIPCVQIGISNAGMQHSFKHEVTMPQQGTGANSHVQPTTWHPRDKEGLQTGVSRTPLGDSGLWQACKQVCPGHHVPGHMCEKACPGHQVATHQDMCMPRWPSGRPGTQQTREPEMDRFLVRTVGFAFSKQICCLDRHWW